MSSLAFLAGLVTLAVAQPDGYSMYDGKPLVRCDEQNQEVWDKLNEAGCRMLNENPTPGFLAICDPATAAAYGNETVVEVPDSGAHFRSTGGVQEEGNFGVAANTFYTRWTDLAATDARVQQIVSGSNGAAVLETIGSSHEGRSIKAVKITGRGWKKGDPRMLVTSLMHAREWLGGMSGLYAVEMAVEKAKSDPNWLAGMELVFVPVVNPDGFAHTKSGDRFWRKNRNPNRGQRCKGVDLNRNWDKDFGGRGSTSRDSCSDTFIGARARSEPEAQAVASLIAQSPLDAHIDIHAFSQLILGSWSYADVAHPRDREIKDMMRKMSSAIRGVNGVTYKPGTGCDLYCASGVFSDYTSSLGALGFTYEVRPGTGGSQGFAPPARTIDPTVKEVLQGVYVLVDYVRGKVKGNPTPPVTPGPKPPATPKPNPKPTPDPKPTPGGCSAVAGKPVTDSWCKSNCAWNGGLHPWCTVQGGNFCVCGGSTNPGPDPKPNTPKPQPPSPTPPTTGSWNSNTVYTKGDTCTYNGDNYVAKWYNKGTAPGGQWGPWKKA